jgi:integrase
LVEQAVVARCGPVRFLVGGWNTFVHHENPFKLWIFLFFMNVKIEAHSNHKFQRKLNAVPSWKVPESTKKEIIDFIAKASIGQVNEGRRLSDRTLGKYLSLLKHSLEIINKQTSKIIKKDIELFDQKLSREGLASVTDYRRALKVFLCWKIGEIKTKKLAGWLDTRDKMKTPDYLTDQEVDLLFKNCKNACERFLIAVLFDSGSRAEEFLNIRYEDIELPKDNVNFSRIMLKEEYSKTLGRNISLYWKRSLGAIRDYLKQRIDEGIKTGDPVYTFTYDAMRMFLSRLGKKVLNKQITPHLFRHSSATYYASKLNRQELCYRYGWKFSSNMPDVYISRAGMESKQLDEKFKATELEELEKRFDKEKFERDLQIEYLESAVKKLLKALKIESSKTKTPRK